MGLAFRYGGSTLGRQPSTWESIADGVAYYTSAATPSWFHVPFIIPRKNLTAFELFLNDCYELFRIYLFELKRGSFIAPSGSFSEFSYFLTTMIWQEEPPSVSWGTEYKEIRIERYTIDDLEKNKN